jgi:hypothetical protein
VSLPRETTPRASNWQSSCTDSRVAVTYKAAQHAEPYACNGIILPRYALADSITWEHFRPECTTDSLQSSLSPFIVSIIIYHCELSIT